MEISEFSEFFETVQKSCLPGIWSKGVALARTDSIFQDSRSSEAQKGTPQGETEIVLRVRAPDHPVSRKVTLWPEDDDWYCDCDDRNDVCAHVAASVIAMKTGKLLKAESEAPKDPTQPISTKHTPVQYLFKEQDSSLLFERWVFTGPYRKERLSESLVAWVGGIRSGRIRSPLPSVTQDDFAIDAILGQRKESLLDSETLSRLLSGLSKCSNIYLDDQSVKTSAQPMTLKAELIEEKNGFRLRTLSDESMERKFKNGAVLQGTTLRAVKIPQLTAEERSILQQEGKFFHPNEVKTLLTQILPSLQKKLTVEIKTQRLPKVVKIPPHIQLEMNRLEPHTILAVTPRLEYGISSTQRTEIPLPDPHAEEALKRKLQSELQLLVGQSSKFEGEAAVNFVRRVKNSDEWVLSGNGVAAFSLRGPIAGFIEGDESNFQFYFREDSRNHLPGNQESNHPQTKLAQKIDAQSVFRAWRENQRYIPLLEGGWAPLPLDWLSRYGQKIESLLVMKETHKTLPRYFRPELAQTFEDLGLAPPPSLAELRERLRAIEKIPEAQLPQDLNASLRPYQKQGVNWLSYLRDSQLGAMLADDMGLGKTLQALCAIRGKTLIIAPTSVLQSWESQIQKFRPSLSVCRYHGAARKLDRQKDVILSSYALLRMDREILTQEKWDTVILDETQTIKNPDSQTAQAAHQVQAGFRIALSGTPIENRLEDLWSQFQFINPGLLGTHESFQDSYSQPISRGQRSSSQELQRKIKPFILRRLKKEVAPELPPKTETILYCDLSQEERDTYSALLAATRQDVLNQLEQGGSVLAALELLLRLRQVCCHTALIPGQAPGQAQGQSSGQLSSSKLELLLETLETSIALGHRSLVFSQWTSYLDLIEKRFKDSSISFTRLDGSTRDRQKVITEFQNPDGPSVMLISLKAGGMGLTLTAADHVFIMDPWWNPSVEEQAADRAHRIGQTNPVLVHRLIAQNTIEERILELQKSKTQLATQVLEGTLGANSLSRDDLLSLLKEI